MNKRTDKEIQDRIERFVELLAFLERSESKETGMYTSMRGQLLGMLWITHTNDDIISLGLEASYLIATRMRQLDKEQESRQ